MSSLVQRFPAGRTNKILDAAVTRDRRRLVVLTADFSVTGWDTETGQPTFPSFQLPLPSSTATEPQWLRLTLNSAGTSAAILGEYRAPTPENAQRDVSVLQHWDLQTGRLLFDAIAFGQEPRSWIESIHFLHDDKQLVVTQYVFRQGQKAQDGSPMVDSTRLHVFNAVTGALLRPAQDFNQAFRLLDFTSDGQKCLVFHQDDSRSGISGQANTQPAYVQLFETQKWQPISSRMTPLSGSIRREVSSR